MLLGVEIIAEKSFLINEGNFFESLLIVNNLSLPLSSGKDVYLINGILLKDKRLAALGRTSCYSLQETGGQQLLNALSAQLVDLKNYSPGHIIKLKVNNNIFLEEKLLTQYLGLRLFNQQKKVVEIPLNTPDFSICCFGKGQFYLDLSYVMQFF